MNVLSLFDGMSCGRIALDRLGIKVDNYYASEIDKYAMKVSEANYPDIIQVGDVTELDTSTLPNIDLVMGGSPCQGFSIAGKQLAFDDPRSALFFEFVRCVKELKPKYFLLENVRMKKEYLDVISEYMGVEPIMINSALVSAQNRVRYYWTNIPGVEQPEQRGIVLRDILETNTSGEYLAGENLQKNYKGGNQLNPNYKSQANTIHDANGKSGTICAGTHGYANGYIETHDKPKQVGTAVDIKGHDQIKRVYSEDGKSSTLTTCGGGHREPKVMVDKRKPNQINPSKKANGVQPYMQDRVFHVDGKSHALTREFASRTNVGDEQEVYWRKLTPVECERLQTVPDDYTNHVSNTQRYKMLGNGWTVEVIAHILQNMEINHREC
jgi:DNA-cytosine methyltransferase